MRADELDLTDSIILLVVRVISRHFRCPVASSAVPPGHVSISCSLGGVYRLPFPSLYSVDHLPSLVLSWQFHSFVFPPMLRSTVCLLSACLLVCVLWSEQRHRVLSPVKYSLRWLPPPCMVSAVLPRYVGLALSLESPLYPVRGRLPRRHVHAQPVYQHLLYGYISGRSLIAN